VFSSDGLSFLAPVGAFLTDVKEGNQKLF